MRRAILQHIVPTLQHIVPTFAAIALMLMPLVAHPQSDVEEYSSLQHSLDSIIATITPLTPDSTKARIYHEVSRMTLYGDSAIKYAQLSIHYCSPDNKSLLARNNCNIGWGYTHKNIYDSAYIYTRNGILYAQQAGDSACLSAAYLSMTRFFETKSINDSALYYAHNALDICIRTKDTVMLTYCYKILGDILLQNTWRPVIRKALPPIGGRILPARPAPKYEDGQHHRNGSKHAVDWRHLSYLFRRRRRKRYHLSPYSP